MRRLPFLVAALLVMLCAAPAEAVRSPWLFVSDIHLDPKNHSQEPVSFGDDTNFALLDSALAEMKRVDPDPPVVMITGDFLAHAFNYTRAIPTMTALAERFDLAFPQAQFVIALGNEDSGCTDYGFAPDSAFSRGTAAVWAPLVNRHGAAPGFAKTFARDGFYTARLPLEHTTAVVIDDVFWSPRYRSCGETGGGARTMAELRAALNEPGDRHWVVAHIPPGIDAYTTAHLAHSLAIVPFLDPDQRYQFTSLIDNPANRVSLVLAAHTHKFSYRIAGKLPDAPLPIFLIPALSPIFGNAPSFLTVDVDPSGTIRSADDHAYLDGSWTIVGGTQTLGLSEFTGANLLKLQQRLESDEALRAVYARLYESGAKPEINDRNWRIYWCAATNFSTGDFRACSGAGGFGLITRRGERLAALAALVLLAAICVAAAIRRLR